MYIIPSTMNSEFVFLRKQKASFVTLVMHKESTTNKQNWKPPMCMQIIQFSMFVYFLGSLSIN